MFKRSMFLGVLLCLVSISSAWQLDSIVQNDWDKVCNYKEVKNAIPVIDTIGDTDSVVIFSSLTPVANAAYVLKFPVITGEGSDTVNYHLLTRGFAENGTLIGTVTDTIKVATGKDILLAINRTTLTAAKYSVTLKGVTVNGGEHIFPGLWVYRVVKVK